MANKRVKHSFTGMNQDISKYNYPPNLYYDSKNIRITSANDQSTFSVINEKGNTLSMEIPIPLIDSGAATILHSQGSTSYSISGTIQPRCELEENYFISEDVYKESGIQKVIGHSFIKDYIILFTTDSNGFDCIWRFNPVNNNIDLLYLRNLGWSIETLIQTVNNFENDKIDKVYWVDSKHQLRFINTKHGIVNGDNEEIIDVPSTTLNSVGEYSLNQPIVTDILSGGTHTSGMIMYAYNLYRVFGSQTSLSPVSELISLDKGPVLGGGDVNEYVGAMPVVKISNIDQNYTNIRVYAIKYTSYNQTPSVSIIEDRKIPYNKELTVTDDGSIITTSTVDEILFLGSDVIIPRHIASKDNRLFYADFKEKVFEVKLDTRAYGFSSIAVDAVPKATVYTNVRMEGDVLTGDPTIVGHIDFLLPEKHDAINLDPSNKRYQIDGVTKGGEGKYLKYKFTTPTEINSENKYFKDDELYRIAIQFYNSFGQITTPYWIADFTAPSGNLNGNFNSLEVTLKSEFFVWLNNTTFDSVYDIPTGYKILVAERNFNDHTIVTSGILSTMMIVDKSRKDSINSDTLKIQSVARTLPKIPNILLRNCNNTKEYGGDDDKYTKPLRRAHHLAEMNQPITGDYTSQNSELRRARYGDVDTFGRGFQFNAMYQLYSPETIFNESFQLTPSLKLKIKGSYKNTYNAGWVKLYEDGKADLPKRDLKFYGGVSDIFAKAAESSDTTVMQGGIVGYRVSSDSGNRTQRLGVLRQYGNVPITDNFTSNTKTRFFISNPLVYTHDVLPGASRPLPPLVPGNDKIRILSDEVLEIRMYQADGDITATVNYVIAPSTGDAYVVRIYNAATNTLILTSASITGATTQSYAFTPAYVTPSIEDVRSIRLEIEGANGQSFDIDVNAKISYAGSLFRHWDSLDNSIIIPTGTTESTVFTPITHSLYEIYGTPELTDKAQDFKTYNNDSKYRYTNSLKSVTADGNTDSGLDDTGNYGNRIISVNSYNNRCITLVLENPLDNDDSSVDHLDRPHLEDIMIDTATTGDNNAFIAELVKSEEEIFLGGIYGGNSYEDKRRTRYFEVGDYKKLDDTTPLQIDSPGDTFVDIFKFERIFKAETERYDSGVVTLTEIIAYPSESKINLRNRNDLSLTDWDNRFQPSFEEYHKYNRVYSQKPNIFLRRNTDYNFRAINNFKTDIISSKLKIGGEVIDSWSDLLQNERLTLDGKFGAINSLVTFNDNMFAIQDTATSFISVNPVTQVQGSDGVTIELGRGQILNDYKYLSTEFGTINKWSVTTTPLGIYSYDAINKSFNRTTDQVKSLSIEKGMRTFFNRFSDKYKLAIDNPLLNNGISIGYDHINNDVLLSFYQDNLLQPITISFSENIDNFSSSYSPSTRYISKGDLLYLLNNSNNQIWKSHSGEYNKFFDEYIPSSITLLVTPERDNTVVLDNIAFESEVYKDGVDKPNRTISHIKLYNEYQTSALIPLLNSRNGDLRRKFREWNVQLPREENTRNRIRNPWNYIRLEFQNEDDLKLILHSPIISYTI